MKLLLCCEFYAPSIGGVQIVTQQIAEHLASFGHDVTVATTRLPTRDASTLNGVRIAEFKVSGNLVRGLEGEYEKYQKFVLDTDADGILINAAQQWTFDALWPILDQITARKVFIPCGFSRLHHRKYAGYYAQMPEIMRQFDSLVFCTEHYRDIDFARRHGLTQLSIIPNGASEAEFGKDAGDCRTRLGISSDNFVFLTVGSLTGAKGHAEIAEAFALMDTDGRPATLVLNGNLAPTFQAASSNGRPPVKLKTGKARNGYLKTTVHAARRYLKQLKRVVGWRSSRHDRLPEWIARAQQDPLKRVLCTDLARSDLIAMFQSADLFVLASKIEYSPLVLFEAAAAGTPFLSVPVGNAEEIARWTGGGIICPAPVDRLGYTHVDPRTLATAMGDAMRDDAELVRIGECAKENWRRRFTWSAVARQYEALLTTPTVEAPDVSPLSRTEASAGEQ